MTVRVTNIGRLPFGDILVGRPAISMEWVALAQRNNALRGGVRSLWPMGGPPHILTTHSTSETFKYALRTWRSAHARDLLIQAVLGKGLEAATLATTITTGTVPAASASSIAASGGSLPLSSYVGGDATLDLELTVRANATVSVWGFSLQEVGRETLEENTVDYGVNPNPFLPFRPVEQNANLDRLWATISASSPDYMRRVLYGWSVPYSPSGYALTTTTTATLNNAPITILPRRFQASTTRVKCWVYGYGPAGSYVKFAFARAGSLVVSLPSTLGWASGTISLYAEDMTDPAGRPSGGADTVQVVLQSDGTSTAYLYTACVIEDE